MTPFNKSRLILFILLLQTIGASAQGEINNEHKILFRNEKTFGISANSNGFGFGYRYAKYINIHKKWIFEGDINLVKHPKERKRVNGYVNSSRRFVYGKANEAFNLRFAFGRQIELFKKADYKSISIRLIYSGGPALTFLKPIRYLVYQSQKKEAEWEFFKKGTPIQYIIDRTPFHKNFENIQLLPGIFLRTSFGFEFNDRDKRISLLEVGITAEAYLKRVKIMEIDKNPFFIPALYIAYRFGKVSSGYHLKKIDEEGK
ncbi:MAG: hypothetical protein CSB06_03710 [Bacteroidia bacterium]|nr:MAG: hypothetical protein CSB06_03710 [Bacteroidia bacterium]